MKKVVVFFVVILFMLGVMLTACTPADVEENTGDNVSGDTVVDDTATGDDAPVDDQDADVKEPIKVGVIQDITGPSAVQGASVQKGIELHVNMINEAGGIDGHPIELYSYDCELNPELAITEYQRLAQVDGVVAVLGPPLSNVGLACVPITNETQIPFVGAFAMSACMVNAESGEVNKYMFAAQPTAEYAGAVLADYAINQLGFTKFAVISRQDQAYLAASYSEFVKTVEAEGAEIVSDHLIKSGDMDFKVQINSMVNSGAEMIIFFTETNEGVVFVNQTQQLGVDMPLGTGAIASLPFIDLVDNPEAVDNLYFTNNLDLEEERVQDVRQMYLDAYGIEPDVKSYIGYDLVTVLVTAIEKAGYKYDSASITESLENNIQGIEITQGTFSFSADHMPLGLSMVIYKIENGEYIALERWSPES